MKLFQVVFSDGSDEERTFTDESLAKQHMGDTGTLVIIDNHHDSEFDDKLIALAAHLGCSLESINENADDTYDSDDEPGEYRVLTDSEADEAFNESIENYVDECILPECPENIRNYFDTDRFRRDVEISDGRGPSLASYDSEENEEKVDGEWFFIYRVN